MKMGKNEDLKPNFVVENRSELLDKKFDFDTYLKALAGVTLLVGFEPWLVVRYHRRCQC